MTLLSQIWSTLMCIIMLPRALLSAIPDQSGSKSSSSKHFSADKIRFEISSLKFCTLWLAYLVHPYFVKVAYYVQYRLEYEPTLLNLGAGVGITFYAKALLSEIKENNANFENSHYTLNSLFFILLRLVWLIFQNFNPFTLHCAIVCPLPRPPSALELINIRNTF